MTSRNLKNIFKFLYININRIYMYLLNIIALNESASMFLIINENKLNENKRFKFIGFFFWIRNKIMIYTPWILPGLLVKTYICYLYEWGKHLIYLLQNIFLTYIHWIYSPIIIFQICICYNLFHRSMIFKA